MAETDEQLQIPAGSAVLVGDLSMPDGAQATVVFAHGSGSSRLSPRNRHVAAYLREQGLGTLLFDLLTADEELIDNRTREYRFDIPMLAERLVAVTRWLLETHPDCAPVGYFGASTGAAAALVAAAELPDAVRAVVSRGGRPDLADAALERVHAATLLLVGQRDAQVLNLNRLALQKLRCEKALEVIPGATHLFEEPGALDQVAAQAADWFCTHLPSRQGTT